MFNARRGREGFKIYTIVVFAILRVCTYQFVERTGGK